jgi:protein O-mannosyl-transferase
MLNKLNISPKKQILIVYASLTIITLAGFWQVTQHEFNNADEAFHVTENYYVQSGITLDGIRWAFSNTWARFWHPLTWLSLMLDYQIYGLNAFGYNLTNIILHVMSTLLLFWLFNRMTGDIWKSAFIAALFALHPLQLILFGSIHRRKDFLSAFFWMLTLCLYVYYTEKPVIKRYMAVCFSFICALMSKPIVVTLPVIMILLDYWPLRRFRSLKISSIFRQLKEKSFFFVLSAVFSVITIYAHDPTITQYCPLDTRIARASVAYLIHLHHFFLLPYETPFFEQISFHQVLGPFLLILFISVAVTTMAKRLPYLFVGWLWYIITLLPAIGIVQCGHTDLILPHYAYLSSIGIVIMLTWGIPLLIPNRSLQKIILFPIAIAVITFLAIITCQMSTYYRNTTTKVSRLLQVTNDNYIMHNSLGISLIPDDGNIFNVNLLTKAINFQLAFPDEKKLKDAIDFYNKAISQNPDDAFAYNNRGTIYNKLGQHQLAIDDYNQAINLKPDYSIAYTNRVISCHMLGFKGQSCSQDRVYRDLEKACSLGNCKYLKFNKILESRIKKDSTHNFNNRWTDYSKRAIDFFSKFINQKSDNAQKYNDRGVNYSQNGQYKLAIEDFNKAIYLKPDFVDAYNNRGLTYSKDGQYQLAIDDFNQTILLKPDFTSAYINRGVTYLTINNKETGCLDAQKACSLGNCELLKMAKANGYCR